MVGSHPPRTQGGSGSEAQLGHPVPEILRLWALHCEPCPAYGAIRLPVGFWLGGPGP